MRKTFYSSLGVMALLISTAVFALPEDVLRALDEPDKPKVKKPKPKPVLKEQPKPKPVKEHHPRKKSVREVESEPVAEPVAAETRQSFEPEMVKLPNGKWMGKYEVTIGEYMACVDDGGCKNPEWLESGNQYNFDTRSNDYYKKLGMSLNNKHYPITGVSWNDTQAYIAWLNGKTNKSYRLPTEDEWFAACQAGKSTEYCGSNNTDEVAWYDSNSGGTTTHEVGQKTPNAWGLYDMSGNVTEWTASFYDETKTQRVLRGGSWYDGPRSLRSASRGGSTPDYRYFIFGFRLSRM